MTDAQPQSRPMAWLFLGLILFQSFSALAATDSEMLAEFRNLIEHHPNDSELLGQYADQLAQFKDKTSDRMLKFRADYWILQAQHARMNNLPKDERVKEIILKKCEALFKEYPEYEHDSRMVIWKIMSRDPRLTKNPASERDFVVQYLKGDDRKTVYMPDSEERPDGIYAYCAVVLSNFEFRKLADEEIRISKDLYEKGHPPEEIRAISTPQNEKDYIADRTNMDLLESIAASRKIIWWIQQSFMNSEKGVSEEFKKKINARFAPLKTPELMQDGTVKLNRSQDTFRTFLQVILDSKDPEEQKLQELIRYSASDQLPTPVDILNYATDHKEHRHPCLFILLKRKQYPEAAALVLSIFKDPEEKGKDTFWKWWEHGIGSDDPGRTIFKGLSTELLKRYETDADKTTILNIYNEKPEKGVPSLQELKKTLGL